MTVMATEKVHLSRTHPIIKHRGHAWYYEHEEIVFKIEGSQYIWSVTFDFETLQGCQELLDFAKSGSLTVACFLHRLDDARTALAEFIASEDFAARCDAYRQLPVKPEYRR